MNPKINIISDLINCVITIEDQTTDYLNESANSRGKREFKASECLTVGFLYTESVISDDVKYSKFYFGKPYSAIDIPVEWDGVINICFLILPSKEYIEKAGTIAASRIYCTDGENVYKYLNGKFEEIKPAELLQGVDGSTISRTQDIRVSICNLKKCYVNLCLLIFQSTAFTTCWNKSNIDCELSFKRDLVWMAINVIEYLSEKELLLEVLRIIDNIEGCNGLCVRNKSKSKGCGCASR